MGVGTKAILTYYQKSWFSAYPCSKRVSPSDRQRNKNPENDEKNGEYLRAGSGCSYK